MCIFHSFFHYFVSSLYLPDYMASHSTVVLCLHQHIHLPDIRVLKDEGIMFLTNVCTCTYHTVWCQNRIWILPRKPQSRVLLKKNLHIGHQVFSCNKRNVLVSKKLYSQFLFNLLKPTGYVMHQQFNIQQFYSLPTLYLCVLYLSQNKQRLVPLTS